MPSASLFMHYRRPRAMPLTNNIEALRYAKKIIDGIMDGSVESDGVRLQFNDSITPFATGYVTAPAAGLIIAASGTGTVGATIGGTAVTVTWATSDTATQTALAAKINADAVVGLFCNATNKLMSMTCTSVLAGTTVQVFSQTFTAIANGVTPTVDGQFTIGASDTACALSLAKAINAHPSIATQCRAVSVAGVVYIGIVGSDSVLGNNDGIRYPSATTIAVGAPLPVAGTRIMLTAAQFGYIGNFVTVVASGTNYSYATNGNSGQLGQGLGGALLANTADVIP